MNPARELKKIASELESFVPYSVGGYYHDGREFGHRFWSRSDAQEYFEDAKSWAASVALFKWENAEDSTEIDSWMSE